VFVHVPPAPARLSARCAHFPVADDGVTVIGGNPASPSSLLLAADDGHHTFIDDVAQNGRTTRLLTFRDTLPVAIDRSGTHILYLQGHNPPALWRATIDAGHLTDRRRLIANSNLGPIAW